MQSGIRHHHARYLLLASLLLLIPAAHAQSTIGDQLSSLNPQVILKNISDSIPNLMRLVTALAYLLGIFMIIAGIVKMKHLGEMRTQMSYEHSIWSPLVQITIGALLLYLPSSVQMGMNTFWTEPNPYGYLVQSDQWAQFMNVCFMVIQLIGTIAFIRGLVMLSHAGGHGGQNTVGKGLTHIIGGILCINIYQFIQVIFSTIGINT